MPAVSAEPDRADPAENNPRAGALCRAKPARHRRSHCPPARPGAPVPARAAGGDLSSRLPAAQPDRQGARVGGPVPGAAHDAGVMKTFFIREGREETRRKSKNPWGFTSRPFASFADRIFIFGPV